jgi:hypothetical protein
VPSQLVHAVPLIIPGFSRTVPANAIYQRSFHSEAAATWYQAFVQNVASAIGSRFLPIYRMADGEFIFCVGYKKPTLPPNSSFYDSVRNASGYMFQRGKNAVHRRALATCWGEVYTVADRRRLMPEYISYLKTVAENGYLAIHLSERADKFGCEYIDPMIEWMYREQIGLSEENYASFYFVYALLASADKLGLFRDRNVAVMTHLTEARKKGIVEGLQRLGARSVQCIPISATRTLVEPAPLENAADGADIVLVGGGIGAVKILANLASTGTVCLDAGFFIDALIDPSMRGQRLFTKTDDE